MSGARVWFAGALSLAAMVGACGGGAGETGTTSGDATSTTTGTGGSPPIEPAHVWTECQASDQAWVRRALLAIDGRRALGQAEVNAWEDAIKAIRAVDPEAQGASATPSPDGGELEDSKRIVARAMMDESAFRERWSDWLLEALRINRVEAKSQEVCFGPPNPDAIDDGSLAAYVRDHDATAGAPPLHDFTMGQLLSSAIALDDLSVVYRGNLFAMMKLPIGGANVGPEAMERARRQNFGAVFSSAYLHRDLVCLGCHNSAFSVTYDADPARNRHWPVPGLFELALFGASDGKHPPEEAAEKGTDALRAFSVFRYQDVVDGGGARPFGWAASCGAFKAPEVDDPLGIDAYFGSARGARASVWDVERALRRGVDLLSVHGLLRGPGGVLEDADEALAYLVAETIVEKVWDEVMGHPLTIADYFPRTKVQRDILMRLTERFAASHFSLKALLLDVVAHPAFNLKAPAEGCGEAAYELPNVFDPWTTSDADPARRGNSPADGVFAISARPLVRGLHRAMGWPSLPEYPKDEASADFQVAVGFFVKDGEPGFRGLDFQGRLVWEAAYGACVDRSDGGDFIAQLAARAQATPGATVGDAVAALQDRLIGEPLIAAEVQGEVAALTGPLGATDLTGLDGKLRAVCGALAATPQLLLGGVVPADTRVVPALSPPEVSYHETCDRVAKAALGAGYTVTCGGATVSASRP